MAHVYRLYTSLYMLKEISHIKELLLVLHDCKMKLCKDDLPLWFGYQWSQSHLCQEWRIFLDHVKGMTVDVASVFWKLSKIKSLSISPVKSNISFAPDDPTFLGFKIMVIFSSL